MPNDLIKFSAGSLDIGVDTFRPDFTADLTLDADTYNITSGIQQGVGVRYGITPIPGQSDTETPSTPRTPGLMRSEINSSANRGLRGRTRGFKIIPLKIREEGPVLTSPTRQVFTGVLKQFLFLLTGDASHFDLVPQCVNVSGGATAFVPDTNLYSGWATSPILPTAQVFTTNYMTEFLLDLALTGSVASFLAKVAYDSSKFYISSATFVSPSKKIPFKWFAGSSAGNTNSADATHATDMSTQVGILETSGTFNQGGAPSCLAYGDFPINTRGITVYAIDETNNQLGAIYVYQTDLTTIAVSGLQYSNTPTFLFATGGVAAVKASGGTSYGNYKTNLVNDDLMVTDSNFSAAFIAGAKPVAAINQQYLKPDNVTELTYFDLTADLNKPRTISQLSTVIPTPYNEGGTAKNTAFLIWPSFVRGTTMVAVTADGAQLGGLNTGLLRSNSVYEITYSYYNKRLDFESNVGEPVKVQTGANDNICIKLSGSTGNHNNFERLFEQYSASATRSPPLWPNFASGPVPITVGSGTISGLDTNHFLNHTEIRFYYREEGTFEWLPAGSFDAAQYWLRPNPDDFCKICTGAIAGLPGGQPGGFNDYSPLPANTYKCVVNFQNRIFWISDKTVIFSYLNSPFQYPLRNIGTAQTGEFIGAIVHNYPGEAQQTSRLIVFATVAIYVGRFTGDQQVTAIQISPDTSAQFPLDGSDFTFDLWTTVTSFSHRSAVVAEGFLYFWGPQGIYRDNGTANPDRISKDIEPDIFGIYDKTKADRIFSIYNNQTREIIWFYTPVNNANVTYCVIYNVQDEAFLFGRFNCVVDEATVVPLTGDNSATFGQDRTIISVRVNNSATVQRMFFFDYLNRAGDMTTGNELIVKTVATPSTGQRRFTVAAGSASMASIVAGDTISISQLLKYWPASTGQDMLAKVAAVNSGAGTVDIILPDGVTFDASASLTYDLFFPIMHKAKNGAGLHGITYNLETKYWMPNGINWFGRWLWVYLFFKYGTLPKNVLNQFAMGYRTPSGGDMISDTINFLDNSDSNFQLYHALRIGNLNSQGQALKLALSGIHIGEQWTLQYLEAHGLEESGNLLKQYQG